MRDDSRDIHQSGTSSQYVHQSDNSNMQLVYGNNNSRDRDNSMLRPIKYTDEVSPLVDLIPKNLEV